MGSQPKDSKVVEDQLDTRKDAKMVENQSAPEPSQPDFGTDYDEAPDAKESDADFDAPEENAKEVQGR